jgi:endonuclease YncB( thermonuclease family)
VLLELDKQNFCVPPRRGIDVTEEMIDAGMAIVWETDILHPEEGELREMLRRAFVAMNQKAAERSQI